MTVRAFGIDLGSSHCVAGAMNCWGHTEVLRSDSGETLLPCVVLFADERTIVGREAELRGRRHPDRLAACGKQTLAEGVAPAPVGGREIPLEVIQACVLRALRQQYLGEPAETVPVVIAVPAHFNETQRHATMAAAEIAGLPLVDLVNEPIAAGLAFAESTPYLSSAAMPAAPARVLVFDLGGYRFEATLLSLGRGELTMIDSDYDPALGGHDWDLRLADLLAECFISAHGLDPRERPEHLEKLVGTATQMKHALGLRPNSTARLKFGDLQQTVRIAREEFERAAGDLVGRAAQRCDALLMRAGLDWKDLDQVLLVGGATRMPKIRQMLAERLGHPPDDRVNPDEAVARGAAIYCARTGLAAHTSSLLRVTSTATHSLGIQGVNQKTGKKFNKVLIPKGTPLPAKVTREFHTKTDEQHVISFTVLEGESRTPEKCVAIGRVQLRDLPADVVGEWPIDVTYEYSAGGRLLVDAQVRYTDRRVHLETIRAAAVSRAHIRPWQEVVTAQAGFQAFQDVLTRIRAAEAPPPVVLVKSPETQAPQSTGLGAYLRRTMPFLFGRPAQRDVAVDASDSRGVSPAKAAGQSEAAN